MQNPFDVIIDRLNSLEIKLSEVHNVPMSSPIEIIDRTELCTRLDITEPTAIRWEKKGVLPSMRVGSCVRYNWFTVIESLEGTKKGGI